MRRVLISHSWDHPDQQGRLTDLLSRHGYDFYDHSIIVDSPLPNMPTPELKEVLSDRIRRVSAVILMSTADAHKKPLVKHEVEEAIRQNKRLIAVKPWGEATAPIPRLINERADAIVGFRSDQIVPAIEGVNIRNLSDYLIAESEDLQHLAHWVVRGASGAVIIGALTAPYWLPRLNSVLVELGYQVQWKHLPPTMNKLFEQALLGAAIGALVGLLCNDSRALATLAALGGAIGAGRQMVKALSLQVTESDGLFEARYHWQGNSSTW